VIDLLCTLHVGFNTIFIAVVVNNLLFGIQLLNSVLIRVIGSGGQYSRERNSSFEHIITA
jgi:hypothetical protein